MLPGSINLGTLVCAHLPGVPLAFVGLFYLVIPDLEKGFTINYWAAYVLVVPLILGLLIDGLRHGLALFAKKCLGVKKLFLWKHVPIKEIKFRDHIFDKQFIGHILQEESFQFHIYEFFINSFWSCIIALTIIFISSKSYPIDSKITLCLSIFAVTSFLSAQAFRLEYKEKKINFSKISYAKKYPNKAFAADRQSSGLKSDDRQGGTMSIKEDVLYKKVEKAAEWFDEQSSGHKKLNRYLWSSTSALSVGLALSANFEFHLWLITSDILTKLLSIILPVLTGYAVLRSPESLWILEVLIRNKLFDLKQKLIFEADRNPGFNREPLEKEFLAIMGEASTKWHDIKKGQSNT